MDENKINSRHFFHCFPRPRRGETEDATLDRAIRILTLMNEVGLVLAPEVVDWDVSVIGGPTERLRLFQRRACFTELSVTELPAHSLVFGPIAMSCDIAKLRAAGATPVIYVPQGIAESPLSLISTFCVRGAYHTHYVLNQLQQLKEVSDPKLASERFRMPVDPGYELTLKNSGPTGEIVAEYTVKASDVQNVLQHVGFNNIPFDHSRTVLKIFLDMFYPADNTHTDQLLGYYRQREWRLIGADLVVNGRPMCRPLSDAEKSRLKAIDPAFWSRILTVEGVEQQRIDLAQLYDPLPNWNFFQMVNEIFVPERAIGIVKHVVGDRVAVRSIASVGQV